MGHHRDFEDMATRIRPRAASSILLWTILAFFLAFVGWAAFTRLDRTVHAVGRVIPSARLQVVTNLEGGIVEAILVQPGRMVRRGDLLVRLSPVASSAELNSAEGGLAALNARIARLSAELTTGEPDYAEGPLDGQVSVERALHSARMSDLKTSIAAAAAREAQTLRAIAEAQATLVARRAARTAAHEQLSMIEPLVARGIEPRVTIIQLRNAAAIADADVDQADAALARAKAAAAEAQAAVRQVRGGWRLQTATDLASARAERAARGPATPALADRLRRASIVSPVDGRVNRVLVSTVGSSVGAGMPIVEVVPLNDVLTIEATLSPRDIAAVRLGQRARINISAYDPAIYGSMEGRVVTLSPDATVDERTGDSHYIVRVRADADTLRDRSGRILPLGPGMTADVSLLGEKRSILSYLLTPITRLRESAFRE